MDLIWKLILLFTVDVVQGKEGYCISNQRVPASNATTLCTLATPPFSPSGKTYTVNLNINFSAPLWVGYTELAFLYKGCALTHDVKAETSMVTGEANPSICYFHCRTNYVGIEKQNKNMITCFCIKPLSVSSLNLFITTCDAECDFPMNTQCGGKNVVSIYEKVKYPTASVPKITSTGPQHCLAYERDVEGFVWTACNTSLKALCHEASSDLIQETKEYENWNRIVIKCLEKNMQPAMHLKHYSNLSSASQLWTGIIRSFDTCYTADSRCHVEDARQGYIQKNTTSNETFSELRFGFNQSIAALCKSDCSTAQSTASTTPHRESTSSQSQSTGEGIKTSGSTVRPANFTRETFSSENSLETTQNSLSVTTTESAGPILDEISAGNESKSNIVAVYVVVPLIVILIVAGVGFFLWRKRKESVRNKPKTGFAVGNGTSLNDGYGVSMSNASYQDDNLKTDAIGHDYFVLERSDEYAAIRESDMDRADEDEYDTTKTVNKKPNGTFHASGNIYNKLDDVTENTYNHNNTEIGRNGDTYNHLEGVNITGASEKPSGMTRDENASCNDTYSHIDEAMLKQNVSRTKPISSDSDNLDDTYNHTGDIVPDTKQKFSKPALNLKTLVKPTDAKVGHQKVNSDYAYASNTNRDETPKTAMFTISSLPNSDGYDFAKEPPSTASGYELAKPEKMPVYFELSNIE